MKFLFVVDGFFPYHDATAKVLRNLLRSELWDAHECHVLFRGKSAPLEDGNIHLHSFDCKDSFSARLMSKVFPGKMHRQRSLICNFSREIERLCNSLSFDHVFVVLGNFQLLFCSLPSIPHSFLYYDLFVGNYFYRRESMSRLSKLQNRALEKAEWIFAPLEYTFSFSESARTKLKPLFITAFYPHCANRDVKKGTLLHCGAFFPGLREPQSFIAFMHLAQERCKDWVAYTLGDLPKKFRDVDRPRNVFIKARVFAEEYETLLDEAEVLVLVDNSRECPQTPSKTFEYIGLGKKILFFTEGNTNTDKWLRGNRNVFRVVGEPKPDDIVSFERFLAAPLRDERQKYSCCESDSVSREILENVL